ncbi:nitrate reductase [Tessaracoccus sp. MC1865]|uniref:uracil-xanthine permease family protein n=1 Tax=Tessaracoccus sp. MC1865 TaxID=2760310 RepID=UPI0016034666|nr:solute carrier family 23 protein [Tessaracoccus sp. MC1865]MBB1482460.1 nitrate reductase [Tessaracoccus sp. MC1865]QTO38084.1 nitrate reductase [Tessaracoccus sp. MC1865]
MWKLHNNGVLLPDAVVKPTERLGWGRTIGLGAQHVVAMFGATFVFPLLMGLNPQLAVMMSGIATLLFLFVVKHRVPSYLGSSASFVGVATAIYAAGGNPATLTGALFVVGLLLFMAGLIIHFAGARVIHKALPPVVTGAVVMLIGFNLAPVVAGVYWPVDPWLAFVVMLIVVGLSIGLRGFWGRIAIFLSLVIGYVVSWLADLAFGPLQKEGADGTVAEQLRVDWSAVKEADWFGLPPVTDLAHWEFGSTANVVGLHLPQFSLGAIIIAIPVVIALIAENTGHVKAVAEMTKEDLDPLMGRAIAADGAASMLATAVGAGPTTTYAENIGVMAASRVYSTAAYVVAAIVAILFGFSPIFGAVISATPSAVLGGITVVLYGMIGLLGAKIWKENNVDFGNPLNLIPAAAGIIIGVGDVKVPLGGDFELGGIALGTIVTIGIYHLTRAIAPRKMRDEADGATLQYDTPGMYTADEH